MRNRRESVKLILPDPPAGHCERCGWSLSLVNGIPTCTKDCDAWLLMDEIKNRLKQRGIHLEVHPMTLGKERSGRGIVRCGSLYAVITWQRLSDIDAIEFSALQWDQRDVVNEKYDAMAEGLES